MAAKDKRVMLARCQECQNLGPARKVFVGGLTEYTCSRCRSPDVDVFPSDYGDEDAESEPS